MEKKRKDSRGRVLRKGEAFREKEGRYSYEYKDTFGNRKTIYSVDLLKLRKREKQSDDDQYPEPYHGIPEWRERTSCPPHQRSDQYAPRASGTEDRPLPLKLVRSADDHNGIRAARYRKDGH